MRSVKRDSLGERRQEETQYVDALFNFLQSLGHLACIPPSFFVFLGSASAIIFLLSQSRLSTLLKDNSQRALSPPHPFPIPCARPI